jgi:hypothetical protein
MSFSIDVREFVEKTKSDLEEVVKKTAIDLLTSVVDRSPVGNPELWAVNATAVQYNDEVKRLNTELRNDPTNLTKNGRLKPGRLIKDGMDLVAGKEYVGGRFRGNWQVSFDTAITSSIDRIDPKSSATRDAGAALIQTFTIGKGAIWITNNLPYGPRLEYEGWSNQAPAGMVQITVTEFQMYINKAVSELSK